MAKSSTNRPRKLLWSAVVIGAIHLLVLAAILAARSSGVMGATSPSAAVLPVAAPVYSLQPQLFQGSQLAGMPVRFLRAAPDIVPGTPAPHGPRGPCTSCHRYRTGPAGAGPTPVAGASCPPGAPGEQLGGPGPVATAGELKMMPFQEAHWQGLELISFTPAMSRLLGLPRDAKGVVVDEATMPADTQGFLAGDLITAVDGVPTASLEGFIAAAYRVRGRRQVHLELSRKGQRRTLTLGAVQGELGTANGETAPMIRPGSLPPHGPLGPCTSCHHIGSGANLAVDLGDPLTRQAPPIRAGQPPPHRDRGQCSSCHTIR